MVETQRNLRWVFFFIFSVANGEPPIGIPWETFQTHIYHL